MTISAGSRLGPYEVLSPLGAGGMGEVWRARDAKLDRDVALKVLPEEFFEDRDRVARFEREAKSLAALNHPGIAAVHSFEAVDGRHILVMELVEGEGLDARIARGAIPLDEALPVARQIAEALEAAHEKGIVHRDLKPANIMVTPEGRVKLLDFGLAKAFERPLDAAGRELAAASQHPMARDDLSSLPTVMRATVPTEAGVILGTAAYMAIKVLPSHLSALPEVRQRFEREAKTISQFSHPHICTLHDVGSQDGVEYLVMEYLEGETLSDRLAGSALPSQLSCMGGSLVLHSVHEDADGSASRGDRRRHRRGVARAPGLEIRRRPRTPEAPGETLPFPAEARRHSRGPRGLGRRIAGRPLGAKEDVPEGDRLWPQAYSLTPAF